MLELYSPLWEMMDLFNSPFERRIENHGLRNIKRPHNLVNVKDENGNIIAQKLSVVTTPFKKEDVTAQVVGDTLVVKCGSENVKDAENEEVIFRGISAQSYEFSLKLSKTVDKNRISGENIDGVLTITLPLIREEEKIPDAIDIAIN